MHRMHIRRPREQQGSAQQQSGQSSYSCRQPPLLPECHPAAVPCGSSSEFFVCHSGLLVSTTRTRRRSASNLRKKAKKNAVRRRRCENSGKRSTPACPDAQNTGRAPWLTLGALKLMRDHCTKAGKPWPVGSISNCEMPQLEVGMRGSQVLTPKVERMSH